MIGVLAQGRLGNQMFQYSFAYAVSRKLNTRFFIHNHSTLHYFDLFENFKKENLRNTLYFALRNIFRKSRIVFSLSDLKKPIAFLFNRAVNKNIRVWNNTIDPNNFLLQKIENNVLYDGYFQSEDYFKEFKEDIKKLFEIRPQYQKSFLDKKKHLFDKKCIVIHLRRTDYVNYGDEILGGTDMTLPIAYYKKCLSLIKDTNQYNVIFVSDDMEFVKKEFGSGGNYFYESNNVITDFQLLLNADILIISNSSFSWWAAWLNNKANKLIYAPNYFTGFKIKKFYPAGIKVDDWNWVDVN